MSVRARRAASPGRRPLLDADEKRNAATKGGLPHSHGSRGPSAKHYPPGGIHMTSGEWKLLVVVLLVACAVRMYRISLPSSVVFDEVHFGKFASKYIKTQYFVDVHPPLAKLLITLAGFLFGYDGHFDFKDIAKEYDDVPYVAMRMLPAILGVSTVPLAYMTLRALDCRATTALLASLFITFENGLITQSRHILLDSPLVFFTSLTIFFWVGFCNEDKHEPFTEGWWAWLFMSGLSLGAVVSCKWVGLFTIATVGLSTILQLWTLLGDLRISPRLWVRHFLARALCLILVPIVFYMFMFMIHFAILNSSGDGDGFMSSEFQHTLSGRGMADTYADVAVGSTVTLRHVNTQGGYLHSHPHNYPGGSQQQQITLYPHRDGNNDWRIYNTTADGEPGFGTEYDWENEPLVYITPGMRVKMKHVSTEKHLHSHEIRPPVSEVDFQNEVSAYGMPGFAGDMNDDWIVEIDEGDSRDRESGKRLRTLRTKFKLKHALSGCYLFSHKVKLPDWGFEQQEVTCNKNAVRENSLWYIETSTHVALPEDADRVNYKLPGFFSKFFELQQVMWTTNSGLTDRHAYDSRPEAWIWLRRGINFWVKDHKQIYLIGNPFIWWLSSISVISYILVRGFMILRAKRGYRDFDNTRIVKYETLCTFLLSGWALHYFPFFLMSRQLFLHHYFPALYFAVLIFASVFDFLTSTLRPRVRLQIAVVLLVGAVLTYWRFSPLVYGDQWTRERCTSSQWVKTWDFSCADFYEDYSHYGPIAAATTTAEPLTTINAGEGRAPIVVHDPDAPKEGEDKDRGNPNAPQGDNEGGEGGVTTKGAGGGNVPEPGHDIFAYKAEKEKVKVYEPPKEPGDKKKGEIEKEISVVITTGTEGTEKEKARESVGVEGKVVGPQKEKEEMGTKEKESEAEGQDFTSTRTIAIAPEEKPKEKEQEQAKEPQPPSQPKDTRPKGEAEVEAEKAAKELYPDAVEK